MRLKEHVNVCLVFAWKRRMSLWVIFFPVQDRQRRRTNSLTSKCLRGKHWRHLWLHLRLLLLIPLLIFSWALPPSDSVCSSVNLIFMRNRVMQRPSSSSHSQSYFLLFFTLPSKVLILILKCLFDHYWWDLRSWERFREQQQPEDEGAFLWETKYSPKNCLEASFLWRRPESVGEPVNITCLRTFFSFNGLRGAVYEALPESSSPKSSSSGSSSSPSSSRNPEIFHFQTSHLLHLQSNCWEKRVRENSLWLRIQTQRQSFLGCSTNCTKRRTEVDFEFTLQRN